MSALPRILIIDDDWGRNDNSLRKRFCFQLGIRDVTNKFAPAQKFAGRDDDFTVDDPVAEAVFISGQKLINDSYENDLEATLTCIEEGWHNYPRWSLLLLDLCFYTGKRTKNGEIQGRNSDSISSNYFGLQVLRNISKNTSLNKIPVGILSSMERKPIESEFSENLVRFFCDKRKLNGRDTLAKDIDTYGLIEDDNEAEAQKVIGHSVPLLDCLREGRKAARMGNINVLLLGESGTGKELLAKYIHRKSVEYGRREIFYSIDLNTITPSLLESQITGYTQNAWTGAKKDFPGLKVADGGTTFIDEIGDYSGDKQSSLFRILEEDTREIRPLGSTEVVKLNLLIILATERQSIRDSETERVSLMRRINAQQAIILPPLRNRKEDILLLAEYFIEKYIKEHETKKLEVEKMQLEEEAKEWMINKYDWKDGNISSLAKSIRNCVYDSPTLRRIGLKHIKKSLGLNKEEEFLSKALIDNNTTQIIKDFDNPKLTGSNEITIDNFETFKINNSDLEGKLIEREKSYKLLNTIYIVKGFIENRKKNGKFVIKPTMEKLCNENNLEASAPRNRINKFSDLNSIAELEKKASDEITLAALRELKKYFKP